MADGFNQNSAEVQVAVDAALKEQKKKKKKKRLIIFGVILLVIIVAVVASSSGDDSSSAGNDTKPSSSSSIKADEDKTPDGTIGDYVCTVKSAKLCKNWDGKDSVKITYSFTNNNDEAESFDIALSDEVYQDGIQLESTFLGGDEDDDFGIDVKIKPGMSKDVSKVYILRDKTTPLDIEISEFISLSDDVLTYKVDLK